MVQSAWIDGKGVRHTGFRTRAETARAVRSGNRKATRIADSHAVACQYTAGKRRRSTAP